MKWLAFSYSLPSQSSSSPRVTLWRRLRRLGAVSPTGGIYVLPFQDACLEGLQWLAQEIQEANGQALVMHVEEFEGFTNQQVIELFREARQEDYAAIKEQALALEEEAATVATAPTQRSALQDRLMKLQRQHADVHQIDYFDSPEGRDVAVRLGRIAQALAPPESSSPQVARESIEAYADKKWVTRPQPHVDRLACAWLIRRFINPEAEIRYGVKPEPDEIAFDMNEEGFTHRGNLCTFETMIRAFGLDAPGLSTLAEIVHEVDLRDERYFHPEIPGVDAILQGWLQLDLSDDALEKQGLALFEGLFAIVAARSS